MNESVATQCECGVPAVVFVEDAALCGACYCMGTAPPTEKAVPISGDAETDWQGDDALTANAAPRRIAVRGRGRMRLVRPEDVDWISSVGNYAQLHVGSKTYLIRSTMEKIAETLAGCGFVRVHRRTIVNVDRVEEVCRQRDQLSVILNDGTRLDVQRVCYDQLLAAMELWPK